MKIRIGFVSNSSSSSFVLFGYKVKKEKNWQNLILKQLFGINTANKTEDEIYDIYCENKFEHDTIMILNDADDGIEDGYYVIGVRIADMGSEGDCLNGIEISLADLMKECVKLKGKLKLKEEPKLFTGTRSC